GCRGSSRRSASESAALDRSRACPSHCRRAPTAALTRRVPQSGRYAEADVFPARGARAKTRKTEPLVELDVPPSLQLHSRSTTGVNQRPRTRATLSFSTSGNGRGSSAEADRIGFVIGRGEPTWSILPGWTCRWRKRRFASWRETALSFTRRRCRLRRRISRPSLRSFQPADASYSRPAEWLRCSTMVYANSDCRLSASK